MMMQNYRNLPAKLGKDLPDKHMDLSLVHAGVHNVKVKGLDVYRLHWWVEQLRQIKVVLRFAPSHYSKRSHCSCECHILRKAHKVLPIIFGIVIKVASKNNIDSRAEESKSLCI